VNSELIIVFVYSYILGSIPFGLIITKLFLKQDVRNIGSGNIGATNVLRTGNKTLAILTLLLDVAKGYTSVIIASFYFNDFIYTASLVCFIGHIFPVWLKFRGGKGVATYLGILLGLSFNLSIIFIIMWLLILFIFRYSSLSSILSSVLIFFYSLNLNSFDLNSYLFIAVIVLIYTHKENIKRLKSKTENKIKF
jgi:acyl phosphate:glycerol-3-phosphate acyltransferase